MNDVRQIRLVATNFYNLQGLRAVPLGALLVFVTLWANGLHGPARDLRLPLLGMLAAGLILWAIDRYYLLTFGRVQRTPESRRLEWQVGILGGALALGAFVLDVSFQLPLSLVGMVFALGLLADYVRITWLVKGRSLLYYPLGAVLMAVISLLPLLGFDDWWLSLGLRDQLVAIALAIGIFSVVGGIFSHMFLARTLPPRPGGNRDESI